MALTHIRVWPDLRSLARAALRASVSWGKCHNRSRLNRSAEIMMDALFDRLLKGFRLVHFVPYKGEGSGPSRSQGHLLRWDTHAPKEGFGAFGFHLLSSNSSIFWAILSSKFSICFLNS